MLKLYLYPDMRQIICRRILLLLNPFARIHHSLNSTTNQSQKQSLTQYQSHAAQPPLFMHVLTQSSSTSSPRGLRSFANIISQKQPAMEELPIPPLPRTATYSIKHVWTRALQACRVNDPQKQKYKTMQPDTETRMNKYTKKYTQH